MVSIVAALLIVLDPIGLLPIMIGMAAQAGKPTYRKMVLKIVFGSTVLLLFFIVTGTWVLNMFKVTLDDMRIGGGLLLLIIAIRLVVEGKLDSGGDEVDEKYKAAIIPIISPLLIGPGAITASVVMAAVHGVWLTFICAFFAMLICLILFWASSFIHKLIGEAGADILSRIMGVFIAAIAIGYIREGIFSVIKSGGGS